MRFIREVVLSHKIIDRKSLPSALIFTYFHFAHPRDLIPPLAAGEGHRIGCLTRETLLSYVPSSFFYEQERIQ